jgi:hypothetical protein
MTLCKRSFPRARTSISRTFISWKSYRATESVSVWARSPRLGRAEISISGLTLLLAIIHPSAWKRNSPKFAVASSPGPVGPFSIGVDESLL